MIFLFLVRFKHYLQPCLLFTILQITITEEWFPVDDDMKQGCMVTSIGELCDDFSSLAKVTFQVMCSLYYLISKYL